MRNGTPLRNLVLLLAGLVLAAGNAAASGEEEAAATGPITLGLLNAKGMAWANNEDLMASQAEEYNRIHGTEITVESSLVPFENLHEKALTDFVSGTGSFDMISVLGDWLAEFIRGGFLEPLDDYLAAQPPDGYPEQFPPALMWMQTGPDGKIYGLPFHDGPIMFYYRKDLIEDAQNQAAYRERYGYELGVPKTWAQFRDHAEFFTTDDNYGTILGAKQGGQQLPYDFMILLYNHGGKMFDDEWRPAFNTEAGLAAMQFYVDLLNTDMVADPASTTWDVGDKLGPVLEGRTAVVWDWTHVAMLSLREDQSKVVGKLGWTTMPVAEEGMTPYTMDDYWVWSIGSASRHKQAVYDFIRWQVSRENDALTYTKGSGVGVRYDNYRDPEMIEQFPFVTGIEEALSVNYFTPPKIPEYAQVNDVIGLAMSEVIAGRKDARTALNEAEEKVDQIMRKAGYY